MPRGATSNYYDSLSILKLIPVVYHARKHHLFTSVYYSASYAILECHRLLKYLLEHEMIVSSFFQLGDTKFQGSDINLFLLVF